MYVHIVTFDVKEGNEITFIEMQKFEEKTDAKPSGLVKYQLLKDRNIERKYWLMEFWETKEAKDEFEETDTHKEFHKLRDPLFEKKYEVNQCDVII